MFEANRRIVLRSCAAGAGLSAAAQSFARSCSGTYPENDLSDGLAKAARHLLADHFGIPQQAVADFNENRVVMPAPNCLPDSGKRD
jgi:hypothetical protein